MSFDLSIKKSGEDKGKLVLEVNGEFQAAWDPDLFIQGMDSHIVRQALRYAFDAGKRARGLEIKALLG